MKEKFLDAGENFKRTKTEGGGLREQLRGKLLDVLDPILCGFFDTKEISRDLARLNKAQENAEQLSVEAGEFFRDLIPNSLRKPEINGVQNVGSLDSIMMREHIETSKLLDDEVKRLTRKEYKNQKKEILKNSLHGRKRMAFSGEVEEIERAGGEIEQLVMNALAQEGDHNLIYEEVSNILSRARNTNHTSASLVIQDIRTGTTLDLNALLPSEYVYKPRAMDKALFRPDIESITGIVYKQKEVADLKDYKMGEFTPQDFVVRLFYKSVDYGDLRKKGNILSLFHEVAHAWQSKYYDPMERGKTGFERLYKTILFFISKLDIPKDDKQHEDPEKVWDKLEKAGVECLDKSGIKSPMNQEGVINIPNTHFALVKLIEGIDISDSKISQQEREQIHSLLAESKPQIRFYPIRSHMLQKALDSYIAEERDAWAHAIRVIRFLRRKGLDVEPELKKLEDFKEIIDPCLASYQDSLEITILNKKTGYKFSRLFK